MHRKLLSASGFTLLELLVVMAILGILVAMIGGNFQSSRLKANDARRKSDLKQIQNALEAYANDMGRYPLSSSGKIMGCGAGAVNTCNWGEEFSNTSTATVYMAQLPADSPAASYEYTYLASSDGRKYQLFARLQNDRDPDYTTYSASCGTGSCSFGIASPNATPTEVLQ